MMAWYWDFAFAGTAIVAGFLVGWIIDKSFSKGT